MRIAILTGGGDVPGLNACLKTVVDRVVHDGHDVVGIRSGWAGLVGYEIDDPVGSDARWLTPLDNDVVRAIDRTGGTYLHTSRVNPARVDELELPVFLRDHALGDGPYDLTAHVLAVIEHLELDAIIAIGGDDTLSYAVRLHAEGVPVVGVPKTMDNDIHGTDYCIGFATAITRSVSFIHQLRTSTASHERIAVIELFGRNSGETSLVSAYLSSVDRAVISEVPFDPERLAALLMEDKRRNPSSYAMVTVSEGATTTDAAIGTDERALGIGEVTGRRIKQLTGQDIISQQLGYLMRTGQPDALDLMVATNFAVMAADLAVEGAEGRMVALRDGTYTNVPLAVTGEGAKHVDVDSLYDRDAYRPKLREVTGTPMFLY